MSEEHSQKEPDSTQIDETLGYFHELMFRTVPRADLPLVLEKDDRALALRDAILFGISIYNMLYRIEKGKHKLVQDLKKGIFIQALFGFLALCGVSFIIDMTLSTHVILPRFYGSEQEYRLYNITSSAFFQLSIFYVMLFHFLLAYNQKENEISAVYIFLILFIGVISGRTFFTRIRELLGRG